MSDNPMTMLTFASSFHDALLMTTYANTMTLQERRDCSWPENGRGKE